MAMKNQLALSMIEVLASRARKCKSGFVEVRNIALKYFIALALHTGILINRLFET